MLYLVWYRWSIRNSSHIFAHWWYTSSVRQPNITRIGGHASLSIKNILTGIIAFPIAYEINVTGVLWKRKKVYRAMSNAFQVDLLCIYQKKGLHVIYLMVQEINLG